MPFPIDCDSAKCAFYFFEHYPALVMFETCPTSDTHAEKTKRTGEEVRHPLWCFYRYRRIHPLCHAAAHGLGGFILLLAGGVSVGAQGESRIVMSKHAADGFHVYTVLQGLRGECVSEIVKAYVLKARISQYLLMQVHDGIGVVHLSCDG